MATAVLVRVAAVWGRNLRKRSSLLLVILLLFSLSLLHHDAANQQTQAGRGKELVGGEDDDEEVDVTADMIEGLLRKLGQVISTTQTSCRRLKSLGGKVSCSCEKNKCTVDGSKQVCFDDDVRPVSGNCFALNFGIGFDVTFDEALVNYGCRVIAVDPTNANMTDRMYRVNITDDIYPVSSVRHDHNGKTFHALNIGVDDHEHTIMLNLTIDSVGYVSNVAPYRTYRSIVDILDNPRVNILKIDIEGVEWRMFEQILSSPQSVRLLKHVQQILLEIHLDFLNHQTDIDAVIDGVDKTLKVLYQLRHHGFRLAAYDANITVQNYFVFQETRLPLYSELTLIRRLPHTTSWW